jgi:hypothetical protein
MLRVQPAVNYVLCKKKKKKSFYLFCMGLSTEQEISCAGALCRLASVFFPLCRVVFSTPTGEISESLKYPQK